MGLDTRLAFTRWTLILPALILFTAAEPRQAPQSGRMLVLENERTLEGNIERVGDRYRVRRSVGELWVRAENVLRLCENRQEAYAYLRSRANLRDADEHLRLANWCRQNGMPDEEIKEVEQAVELRPNDAASRRWLRLLQHPNEKTAAISVKRSLEPAPASPVAIPVTREALSVFATRIQPILMNTCANCHANGRGGEFKLIRTFDNALTNRRSTQQNLVEVLNYVNKDNPQGSMLLTKAVSVHGKGSEMAQPPIRGRDLPVYKALDDWVRATIDTKAELQSHAPVATDTPTDIHLPIPENTGTKPASKSTEPASGSAIVPTDPFDPSVFNQQTHRAGK
jgi:hypothetical protein